MISDIALKISGLTDMEEVYQQYPYLITWIGINQRCHDETNLYYGYYGARGISVAPFWRLEHGLKGYLDFEQFIVHALGNRISRDVTLDRRDNDGHYEPSNLRWATKREQKINQRDKAESTSNYRGLNYTGFSWLAQRTKNGTILFSKRFKEKSEAIQYLKDQAQIFNLKI